MNRACLLSIMIIVLSSCNKESTDILKNHPEFVGDFDWVYSIISGTTVFLKEESDDKFGIRIKRNGKAFLYENGEVVVKGMVSSVNEYEGTTNISFDFEEWYYTVYMKAGENEVLYSQSFPGETELNVFKKL